MAATEPGATRTIAGVRLLDTPAPAYLATADKMVNQAGAQGFEPWVNSAYAFDASGDASGAAVRPHAVMNAGDTLTAEVSFGDGTTEQCSRMINYVFKNIPRLLEYGGCPSGSTSVSHGCGLPERTSQDPTRRDRRTSPGSLVFAWDGPIRS